MVESAWWDQWQGEFEESLIDGDQRGIHDLVKALRSAVEKDDWSDRAWEVYSQAQESALDHDQVDVAIQIARFGSHGGDVNELALLGWEKRPSLGKKIAARLDTEELWRSAFTLQKYARDDWESELGQGKKWMIDKARDRLRSEWKKAIQEGMAARWEAREDCAWKRVCDQTGAPLWSKASCPPIPEQQDDRREEPPEWCVERGRALDIVEDALVIGAPWVEGWSQAVEKAGASADPELWAPERWKRMESGWRWADAHWKQWVEVMGGCSIEGTGKKARQSAMSAREKLSKIAEEIEKEGAAWLIPALICWGRHQRVDEEMFENLAPLIERCSVNLDNVGLVAANVDYGSFNARMCALLDELDRRGQVSEEAAAAIGARWKDLKSSPQWSDWIRNSAFTHQFDRSAEKWMARQEAWELGQASHEGKKPMSKSRM